MQCCLFPPSDFSSEPHGHHSTKINNYHSVTVIAFLCFTLNKWQFYINHFSDILWNPCCPVHSICGMCRVEAGAGVLEHIFCSRGKTEHLFYFVNIKGRSSSVSAYRL